MDPGLLRRFFRGDQKAFGEIAEFRGMHFEEVKIEAELPDGGQRTYNLAKPESGHPLTQDIGDLALDDDGEPIEESLYQQLRAVLSDVTA